MSIIIFAKFDLPSVIFKTTPSYQQPTYSGTFSTLGHQSSIFYKSDDFFLDRLEHSSGRCAYFNNNVCVLQIIYCVLFGTFFHLICRDCNSYSTNIFQTSPEGSENRVSFTFSCPQAGKQRAVYRVSQNLQSLRYSKPTNFVGRETS